MEVFRRFARGTAEVVGTAYAFVAAIALIVGWLASGPIFGFSDTWQLIINTTTTIVTFLMVFVIQNAQNRDARAIHIKLDELIRATTGAENSVIDLARLSDKQLLALEHHYERIGDMKDHEVNEELEDIQAEKKQRKAD
jgi:low affinity Fe/Cu permease